MASTQNVRREGEGAGERDGQGAVGDLLKGNAKPEDLKQQGRDLTEGTFQALKDSHGGACRWQTWSQYVVNTGFRILGRCWSLS